MFLFSYQTQGLWGWGGNKKWIWVWHSKGPWVSSAIFKREAEKRRLYSCITYVIKSFLKYYQCSALAPLNLAQSQPNPTLQKQKQSPGPLLQNVQLGVPWEKREEIAWVTLGSKKKVGSRSLKASKLFQQGCLWQTESQPLSISLQIHRASLWSPSSFFKQKLQSD